MTMGEVIRITLADDEALFRKGLRSLLEDAEGLQVVWEAEDGQDLLDKLERMTVLPHVILLDLKMPRLTGIEAAKVIREKYPELKIIVLSTYFSKAFIVNMIEIGAGAYLAKNTDPDVVIQTIREVSHKGFYYSGPVMEVIREHVMAPHAIKPKTTFEVEITTREQEILQLICEQYTTSEIADKLFISPRTVDGHRNNLLEKLGCRNTAGLVVFAIQRQLVNLPPISF